MTWNVLHWIRREQRYDEVMMFCCWTINSRDGMVMIFLLFVCLTDACMREYEVKNAVCWTFWDLCMCFYCWFVVQRIFYSFFSFKFTLELLTQCLTFFFVKPSPSKTWPRWEWHWEHKISILRPSASVLVNTAPGKASSNDGQPQPLWNLLSDAKRGCAQPLHS